MAKPDFELSRRRLLKLVGGAFLTVPLASCAQTSQAQPFEIPQLAGESDQAFLARVRDEDKDHDSAVRLFLPTTDPKLISPNTAYIQRPNGFVTRHVRPFLPNYDTDSVGLTVVLPGRAEVQGDRRFAILEVAGQVWRTESVVSNTAANVFPGRLVSAEYADRITLQIVARTPKFYPDAFAEFIRNADSAALHIVSVDSLRPGLVQARQRLTFTD